jgi:neurobeachin-like protein 1/2
VEDMDVGKEEDWKATTGDETENVHTEKMIFTTQCELVSPMKLIPGRLEITTTHIYFHEERIQPTNDTSSMTGVSGSVGVDESLKAPKEIKIPIDQIVEIHRRRYLLRRSALEIFLQDRSNYFINCKKRDRNKVFSKILSINPPNLTYFESGTPEQSLRKSELTKKWQQRQISNFEYLMKLNTIAGRTYNDLTQYPVFPWVIADYTSESIDLNDPSIYRDLSKPVGALNPSRLEKFIERYKECV